MSSAKFSAWFKAEESAKEANDLEAQEANPLLGQIGEKFGSIWGSKEAESAGMFDGMSRLLTCMLWIDDHILCSGRIGSKCLFFLS
jgi:hypothetical protein